MVRLVLPDGKARRHGAARSASLSALVNQPLALKGLCLRGQVFDGKRAALLKQEHSRPLIRCCGGIEGMCSCASSYRYDCIKSSYLLPLLSVNSPLFPLQPSEAPRLVKARSGQVINRPLLAWVDKASWPW